MKKIYYVVITLFLISILATSSSAMKSKSCTQLNGCPEILEPISKNIPKQIGKSCSMEDLEARLFEQENTSFEKDLVEQGLPKKNREIIMGCKRMAQENERMKNKLREIQDKFRENQEIVKIVYEQQKKMARILRQ